MGRTFAGTQLTSVRAPESIPVPQARPGEMPKRALNIAGCDPDQEKERELLEWENMYCLYVWWKA